MEGARVPVVDQCRKIKVSPNPTPKQFTWLEGFQLESFVSHGSGAGEVPFNLVAGILIIFRIRSGSLLQKYNSLNCTSMRGQLKDQNFIPCTCNAWAAYLAKDGSRDVTLVIPWLSLKDQELVYPNKVVFDSPLEQEGYVRRWIEERVDFRPSFSIKFYLAKFSIEMRNILPVGDITECVPDEMADIAVLEDPEHLNWYHHERRWKNKFRRVIGVIHTNYLAYVRRKNNGQVMECCLRYANTWVARLYCHKCVLSIIHCGARKYRPLPLKTLD